MIKSILRSTYFSGHISTYMPAVVLLVGILLSLSLAKIDYEQIEGDTKALTNERLYRAKSQLEQALNERLNTTYALEAFVKTNSNASLDNAAQEADFKHKFLQHATALSARTRGLLSIQLAPQAVVSYLTNEERNKAAIGHDLLMDPNRREQTLRAIKDHKLILSGPVVLKQGGEAFIARLSVFTEPNTFDPAEYMRRRGMSEKPHWLDEIPDNFWGIATVLVDVSVLYEEADLDTVQEGGLIALRGRHGLGERGEVFWGNESVFDHPTAAIPIRLPAGEWVIAASSPIRLGWSFYIKIFISLFASLLLYMLISVQRQQVQAQVASEIKGVILANISHEMRTPINGIVGMSESLIESSSVPAHCEKIEIIKRSALNIADMVNDIVDMAEIEFDHLQLASEPFELVAELQSIGTYMTTQAQYHETQLICPVTQFDVLLVRADQKRIRQVLIKLIDNAIRFSNGTRVEVECSEIARSSDSIQVRFAVRDNGVGIERKKQLLLFQAFVKEDMSDTSRHSGLGIGISLSNAIIKAMGGTLEIDSEEGAGSAFFFTLDLPIAIEEDRAQYSDVVATIANDALTPLRLALVVDDNPVNNIVMASAVKSLGFEVETATNGAQAVEKTDKGSYELILMDCQMPVMDGYEATERIRQRATKTEGGNRPLIIACTANALETNRTKCLEVGMDDFLAKPIQREELEQMLRQHGLLSA